MTVEISADARALEGCARDVLAEGVFDYIAGGADDEITLAANEEAWTRIPLRPHALARGAADTSTTMLGSSVATPVGIAPMSYHRMVHPDGELATAGGAAAAGALYVVSTRASTALEDVANAAAGSPLWFQVYILRDRGWTRDLIERASAAGFRALVLTVDAPVLGRRLRDVRAAFSIPRGSAMANLGRDLPEDLEDLDAYPGFHHDASLTFDDIGWLRAAGGLPVVVKGVVRGDDAARCLDAGADAIAVSNHGGRQLDGAISTADALAEVIAAVAGRAEVYVDGGIRTGADVCRALALGARGVLVGRPVLWALAVGGAGGVRDYLDALRVDVAHALGACGASTATAVPRDAVAMPRPPRQRS